MEYRTLGRTGVQVSPLCLGAMMFGAWGEKDHDASIRIIHAALDAGINFVDTADVYSQGENEEIVGKALKGRRDDIVLATKFHNQMGEGVNRRGNSRRWIMRAVEDSLRRLQTDHIDLYQVHRPDPDTDVEETLSALTDLVRAGEDPLLRLLDLPGEHDRRGAVGLARPRPGALQDRAAALQHARARGRERRPPHRPAPRHGRDPVEPARGRLALRPLPQGAGAAAVDAQRPPSRPLRHEPARQPAQVRGRRRARRARGRGRHPADRDRDRVRAQPPGDQRGDHRPAHHGAPGVPAARGDPHARPRAAGPHRRDRPAGDELQLRRRGLQQPGARNRRRGAATWSTAHSGTRASRSARCAWARWPSAASNEAEGIRVVHRALDAGINFIDTADRYSGGESEEMLGKALKGRRDEVVLATKFHLPMGDDVNPRGNSRRWIMRAVEGLAEAAADRLHRPLPGPPARRRRRGDAVGADRPRARRQGALHRVLHVPGVADRRGPMGLAASAGWSASCASSRRTASSCAGSRTTSCRRRCATAWA